MSTIGRMKKHYWRGTRVKWRVWNKHYNAEYGCDKRTKRAFAYFYWVADANDYYYTARPKQKGCATVAFHIGSRG